MEKRHETKLSTESPESYKPQAVLIFLAIMLIGYILYWALIWFVTVQRAGG